MSKRMFDQHRKWIVAAGVLFSVIILGLVAAQMGPWMLLGVLVIIAIAFVTGRNAGSGDGGDDKLKMRIQSLEMQLADEKAVVQAMTGDLEPSDL